MRSVRVSSRFFPPAAQQFGTHSRWTAFQQTSIIQPPRGLEMLLFQRRRLRHVSQTQLTIRQESMLSSISTEQRPLILCTRRWPADVYYIIHSSTEFCWLPYAETTESRIMISWLPRPADSASSSSCNVAFQGCGSPAQNWTASRCAGSAFQTWLHRRTDTYTQTHTHRYQSYKPLQTNSQGQDEFQYNFTLLSVNKLTALWDSD